MRRVTKYLVIKPDGSGHLRSQRWRNDDKDGYYIVPIILSYPEMHASEVVTINMPRVDLVSV